MRPTYHQKLAACRRNSNRSRKVTPPREEDPIVKARATVVHRLNTLVAGLSDVAAVPGAPDLEPELTDAIIELAATNGSLREEADELADRSEYLRKMIVVAGGLGVNRSVLTRLTALQERLHGKSVLLAAQAEAQEEELRVARQATEPTTSPPEVEIASPDAYSGQAHDTSDAQGPLAQEAGDRVRSEDPLLSLEAGSSGEPAPPPSFAEACVAALKPLLAPGKEERLHTLFHTYPDDPDLHNAAVGVVKCSRDGPPPDTKASIEAQRVRLRRLRDSLPGDGGPAHSLVQDRLAHLGYLYRRVPV